MKNFKERSLKGFIWNHLAKLSDYGFTYLISVILARSLDNISYSVFVTTYGVGTAIIIFSSLGIDETVNRFISQLSVREKFGQIKKLLIQLIKYRLAALLLFLVLLLLFRKEIASLLNNKNIADYIVIIVFFIFFQNLSNFFTQYFTSLLNTRLVFFINTGFKIFSVLLISFYLNFDKDLFLIFVIISLISFLSFITYLFSARETFSYKSETYKNNDVKKFFLVMWLNAILSMIVGRYSDIFLLGSLIGVNEEVSNYEVAFSLVTVIDYLFSVGLIGVIISVFSTAAILDKNKLISIRNKIIKYYQFIVLPIMLFSLVFADDLIKIIYSEKYTEAVPLFETFLFYKILIVNILGSGLNVSILVSMGKQKYVLINRSILGIINISVNVVIIPIHGAWGAILVTGFIQLVIYLIDFIVVSNLLEFKYDFLFLLRTFFIICCWLFIIYLFRLSFNLPFMLLLFAFLIGLLILYLFFNKSILFDLKENLQLFLEKG